MTWETVPLGEVSRYVRGVTYKPADVVPEGGIACLRTKNIQSELVLDDLVRVRSEVKHREEQKVRAGDVLISSANSWHLVGRAVQAASDAEGMLIGGFIGGLRFDAIRVDPRFGYHWFASPSVQDRVRSFGQQTTNIANLNVERVLQMRCPVPPLAEQRRIAAILDEAARANKANFEQLHAAEQYATDAIRAALEDAPLCRLGDDYRVLGGKRLPKGAEYATTSTQHPYLRVVDMKSGRFDTSNLKYISPDTHKAIRRYVVGEGDVVISIAGTIGSAATVPRELVGANLTENAARITPQISRRHEPSFLRAAIAGQDVQAQIERATGRVTIGKLPLFRIENLLIPTPSQAIQKEVVALTEQANAVRTDYCRRAATLGELFASLQYHAFRGEL